MTSERICSSNEIKEIRNIIFKSLNNTDIWNEICEGIRIHFEKSSSSMLELRRRTTRNKGLLFEHFCKLYLTHNYKYYKDVWLLSEVPEQVLVKLGMKGRDYGIDIVALGHNNQYYAIQCKYRVGRSGKKNILSWRECSTFFALCSKTGPWCKQIVMTNADYIHRAGHKIVGTDLSICYKTFQNTDRLVWTEMCGMKGYTLNDVNENKKVDTEEKVEEVKESEIKDIKLLRSAFLDKLKNKII
jgi:hypothetical protein